MRSPLRCIVVLLLHSILLSGVVAQEEEESPQEYNRRLRQNVEFNFVDVPHVSRPIFWHIPKAGGTSVQDFTTRCLKLVGASEVGREHQDETLFIFEEHDRSQFVNVDTTHRDGLEHAKNVGFVGSGIAQIIFTGNIFESATYLFDQWNQGSAFTIMRHPIDRAISIFYYLQNAKRELTYHPEWKSMTLKEYAAAGVHIEHDWMVRQLTGNWQGDLTEKELNIAKQFLKDKVWIGLLDHMEESIFRFSDRFGWEHNPKWKTCFREYEHHISNQNKHTKYTPASEEWKLLEKYNRWDIQLYEYAVELFHNQRKFFGNRLEGFQEVETKTALRQKN